MPHCVIEYSRPLEAVVSPQTLMESVHQGAVSSGLFDESAIKVRALPYDHFRVAADAEQGMRFIHVTARILSGRSLEQKQGLSDVLLNAIGEIPINNVSVTVEVVDMEREVYAKAIIG
ncbi:5-carboxymethyl-2-hydroxymuconate Delta-isomerase [Endozoicomonas atrinae]|uniref:5-carboxymethyl-2-hydroxymuconate Delta-isomerase n=1 Tax=Endozoicomonas atrinae TaxID=1333660 RepID=UPI000824E4DB|nr:5-carboxymethyl-2-hydroxymuconate Delta-isomerase [Endozoicomonas atrinae]